MKVPTVFSSLVTRRPGRFADLGWSGPWWAALWAATQGLILYGMQKGDALVAYGRPVWAAKDIWVVVDAPVHGLLAMLVIWPLAAQGQPIKNFLIRLSLAGLAAMLIDVDHFVAAGSFSIYAATHLGYRPVTHSLMFALASAILVWRITRHPRDGSLLFIALASHFLRDASTGGIHYLLWPLGFDRLSIPAYYASQFGLSLASWLSAWWLSTRLPKRGA